MTIEKGWEQDRSMKASSISGSVYFKLGEMEKKLHRDGMAKDMLHQ
jgi:hypothetical protein